MTGFHDRHVHEYASTFQQTTTHTLMQTHTSWHASNFTLKRLVMDNADAKKRRKIAEYRNVIDMEQVNSHGERYLTLLIDA